MVHGDVSSRRFDKLRESESILGAVFAASVEVCLKLLPRGSHPMARHPHDSFLEPLAHTFTKGGPEL